MPAHHMEAQAGACNNADTQREGVPADRGDLYGCAGQVCLAAEECGHLNFDSRTDMWWDRDAFHCGSGPRGVVHFHDIILKVHSQPFPMHIFRVGLWDPR